MGRMSAKSILAAAAICISIVTPRAEYLKPAEINYDFGEYVRYVLTLPDVFGDGTEVTLYLGRQNETFIQTWGTLEGATSIIDRVNADNLVIDEMDISGKIKFGPAHTQDPPNGTFGSIATLTLSGRINGGAISGTYSGSWGYAATDKDPIADTNAIVVRAAQLYWPIDESRPVSGSFTGVVLDENSLKARESIRPGYEWPFWHGPSTNFSATPGGHNLVDDLREARLAWKSETVPCARANSERHHKAEDVLNRNAPAGSGCSPVVKDGRVYLWYFRPSGEEYDTARYEKQLAIHEEKAKVTVWEFFLTRGDDIVLCVDAATGQTIWRTEFPHTGFYQLAAKGLYTTHLSVDCGRVIGKASSDVTFCLDAQDGRLLWEKKLPRVGAKSVIADSVYIPCGEDLVGLDVFTGEEKWRVEDGSSTDGIPYIWENSGRKWILSGIRDGMIYCVDPRNGDVRWKSAVDGTPPLMAVGADHALISKTIDIPDGDDKSQLIAYRLTESGAEKAWELPADNRYTYRDSRLATFDDSIAYIKFFYHDAREFVSMNVNTGEIVERFEGFRSAKHGFSYHMDGRVWYEIDATHGSGATQFGFVRVDGYDVEPVGPNPLYMPHTGTAAYHPDYMTHAFVDGRMIIHGAFGIHCYDFRAQSSAGRPEKQQVRSLEPVLSRVDIGIDNQTFRVPTDAPATSGRLVDLRGRTLAVAEVVDGRLAFNDLKASRGVLVLMLRTETGVTPFRICDY